MSSMFLGWAIIAHTGHVSVDEVWEDDEHLGQTMDGFYWIWTQCWIHLLNPFPILYQIFFPLHFNKLLPVECLFYCSLTIKQGWGGGQTKGNSLALKSNQSRYFADSIQFNITLSLCWQLNAGLESTKHPRLIWKKEKTILNHKLKANKRPWA